MRRQYLPVSLRAGAGLLAAVAILFLHVELALPETIPTRGVADGRIRTAVYDTNEVYRIQGYVGYEIDLQFEPGESFVGLGAGDIDALSFVSQDNHLFIKPKAARVSTNLTVITTRRPYQFSYTASPLRTDASDPDVIFAIRFNYPPNPGDAVADGVNRMLEQSGTARAHNVDYWYCGSPTIQPTAASDDGIHTRLRFAAKAEQPAIFVQNDDGSESLLNFSMDAGDVVIHRVVRQLIIRRGRLTGMIVNKGFTGSGERLQSGTVSPSVERVGEGRRP
ncbi:MAG: type secretion system protein VirB9 [Gammaproteobacteria bacterium]|jgi:type IV secretion system protein VirB9|nr:type secretion system protein VirB9 [Gammaproteobacteria bacterium]